ncbi:MAG: MFS transporter [Candidatus Sumerlaeaceae bacterium]|nr:MFS transporter [Candidatus Sumerlaeaceae bacterium]
MSAAESRQPTLLDVFRNANFVKLWFGLFVSFLGDRVGQIGLVAILSATATAAAGADHTTMITFWSVLPYVLIGPFAGAVVDRYDRRKLMIVTDICRGIIYAALPFVFTMSVTPAALYGVAFIVGCGTCLFQPARSAFLPEIVPPEHLLRANSVTSTMGTLTILLGTVVGGVLTASLARESVFLSAITPWLGPIRMEPGLATAFLLDASTYFFSMLMLLWIRMPPIESVVVHARWRELKRSGSFLRNVADGLAYLRCHRVPALCVLLTTLFFFVGGSVFTVINRIVFTRLAGVDPDHPASRETTMYLGYAFGCLGLGMFTGGIITGRVALRLPVRWVLAVMFTLSALFLGLLAVTTGKSQVYIVLATVGAAAGGVVVLLDTALQRSVPDEMRGRVFALNNLVLNSALLVALVVCTACLHNGWLGTTGIVGAAAAFAGAGTLTAIAGFPAGLSVHGMREDPPHSAEHPPQPAE